VTSIIEPEGLNCFLRNKKPKKIPKNKKDISIGDSRWLNIDFTEKIIISIDVISKKGSIALIFFDFFSTNLIFMPALNPVTRMQIGILIKKTDCHGKYSSKTPPTNGPRAAPAVPIVDQMPSAIARSWLFRNVSLTVARVAGSIIAAPTARKPRDIIRINAESDIAPAADDIPNITEPTKEIFFTPYLSHNTPIGKRKDDIINGYMSIIQSTSLEVALRLYVNVGMATCRIVASIETGRYINIISVRIDHLLDRGGEMAHGIKITK